jgi:assimilatory nitrate reductase catalytic subunit
MPEVKSTCCYCGVGCGVIIETDASRITGVRGDPEHPANFGQLCTKGSTLHLTARQEARAHYPELRRARDEPRRRVSWDQALEYAVAGFADVIDRDGPDAVAFYISGQLLTEDYYVFNKLAKGLVGTNNVDTNSRLCMSSAVAGYKATLGADAPPACYADIDYADCIFIAGSNTSYAHPILFRRIEDAREANPELKLIVVDPRLTDTAAAADLHLRIRPGTDVALFNSMLFMMLNEGLLDDSFISAHTEGFRALRATVRKYSPHKAAAICGVPAADIIEAASWFASSGATLSLYCQGLNQWRHGTDNNAALINLHLATGQIGRPGAGPLSLTGQPNAMGGREVGGMANALSGHRDMANPAHQKEVARLWGVPEVPAVPGKTAVEMFDALKRGEIKAIWIACTNPAQSMPDQRCIREALRAARLVVVEEAYAGTETAEFADVLLPAASWGEKEGTVTNSERRITRVRAAVAPPGEARGDWQIGVEFARRLATRLGRGEHLFPYESSEQIFNEHRESTRGRDLDITGLSYSLLERRGPQQWPCSEGKASGRERLYCDGRFPTESGRAKFKNTVYTAAAEPTDHAYPLSFNTGRLRDQWHGMSRTGTVARLFNHAEEPCLSIHDEDMKARALADGELVKIKSRRGEVIVRARAFSEVPPGQVFLPMHWGSHFLSGEGCNALTLPIFDPVSRQPELKHAAVQVEKADLPWTLVALSRAGPAEAPGLLERARTLMGDFDYASLGLCGRDDPVVVLRTAAKAPVSEETIAAIDAIFQLDDDSRIIVYLDKKRSISKRIRIENGTVRAARLAGETAAAEWLKTLIAEAVEATPLRPWLLAPAASAPAAPASRGRVVCACLNVSERDIVTGIEAGADLARLRRDLKCGTECGSCVPELKRMLAAAPAVACSKAA